MSPSAVTQSTVDAGARDELKRASMSLRESNFQERTLVFKEGTTYQCGKNDYSYRSFVIE